MYFTDLVWDSNIFNKVLQRYNREIFVKILKAEILLKLQQNRPKFAAKSHELLRIENRKEDGRENVMGSNHSLHKNDLLMIEDNEGMTQFNSQKSLQPETDDRIDSPLLDIKSAHHNPLEFKGPRAIVLYDKNINYDNCTVEYEGGEYGRSKTTANKDEYDDEDKRGRRVDQVSRLQISRDRYLSNKRAQQVGVIEEGRSLVGSRINIYREGGADQEGSDTWRMHAILDCHTKWVDDGILAHVTHTLQVSEIC